MQYFLGLLIVKPLTNLDKYLHCLKEMKHYLSFQTSIIIKDTSHILALQSSNTPNSNRFSIVKNSNFLHTQFHYGNI